MIRRACFLVLALTLVSCPSGKAGPRPPVLEKPVRGGTVSALLAEDIDFLDPQRAALPAAITLLRAMHRGLFAYPSVEGDGARTPVPDLATGPPVVTADGRTYTFTVRSDVSFGPPASRLLTAEDVRTGIARLLARGSVSPYAGYFKVIAAVSAPDAQTLVVRLARPVNDALWMLALPAASAVPGDIGLRPAAADIAPSGPYMLAPEDGYRPEESIHLVRNPAWRAETDPVRPAYVDEIRVAIGRISPEIQAALIAGSADVSLDEPPDLFAIEANPLLRPRTHSVANGCLRYLWMNTRVKPFTDARVRRAVAAAIDRSAVLSAAGGELAGVPTAWPLPRTLVGSAPQGPAGPEPSASPALPVPRRFTTRLVVGDRDGDVAQGNAIVASLAAAGVIVRLQTMPIASLYVDGYEVPAKKIPMGLATWCADWNGLGGRAMLTPLLDGRRITARGNNDYAMLNSPALNRLLDAAAVAPEAEQEDAWRAVASLVVRLAPWAPLIDMNEVSLVSARVGGFVPTPAFPRGDLTSIWLRPGAGPEPS